ncbi:MAG: S26 family signal peptidase [Candidatus Poseidoniaceae archaeon]|jgi:signal peptidase|nr:S26 family signal peptidase [Candidatus Poseidoniaceae archaeon]
MSESNPLRVLARELFLAIGMISLIVIAMWAHTGSMPPLVVVESNSMQHDSDGEIGTIDAGDLVLVHSPEKRNIVTFAEATDPNNPNFGHEKLGMPGDVIVYKRNGEDSSTPIIHRAIFKVNIARTTSQIDGNCNSGVEYQDQCILSWSVPGTSQIDVENITVNFDGVDAPGDYNCKIEVMGHGDVKFRIENWKPSQPGYVTLGDNNLCSDDQGVAKESSGISSNSGGLVKPVLDEWVIGISGSEIPWLGSVKLLVSGGSSPGISNVPGHSIMKLVAVIVLVLLIPMIWEPIVKRLLSNSPEMEQAEHEEAIATVVSTITEEE